MPLQNTSQIMFLSKGFSFERFVFELMNTYSYPYYHANASGTNYGAGGGIYNRAGRGYPDVSANGAYLNAYVAGDLGNWFGTSLAAPIFASVITLVR